MQTKRYGALIYDTNSTRQCIECTHSYPCVLCCHLLVQIGTLAQSVTDLAATTRFTPHVLFAG